jgi:hypothetical protein
MVIEPREAKSKSPKPAERRDLRNPILYSCYALLLRSGRGGLGFTLHRLLLLGFGARLLNSSGEKVKRGGGGGE